MNYCGAFCDVVQAMQFDVGDGKVNSIDLVLYRRKFTGQPSPFSTDRCSIIGPGGVGDTTDVVVIRRTFAGQTAGVLTHVCPAFLGLPDPLSPKSTDRERCSRLASRVAPALHPGGAGSCAASFPRGYARARTLRRRAVMKRAILSVIVVASLGLGCQISPVITDPGDSGGDSYRGCRRAAKDYCRDVVGATGGELDRCVSESTFRCMSGRSD